MWALCGEYTADIADGEYLAVEIFLGGKRRQINAAVNMPPQWFQTLLLQLDALADVHHWRFRSRTR